ncbi:hypothetical protein Amal_03677 [Acetobacter malorum]|uniref:Uncharacterized protein n=1 Tax=Acetobacter malorum TaxID=178901 RepID=A0A177G727_9PROT|nr:hypothetical protein Amal_03677 [Acetobacter malorum]
MVPVLSPVKQAETPAIPLKLGEQFYSMAAALSPVSCPDSRPEPIFWFTSNFTENPFCPDIAGCSL